MHLHRAAVVRVLCALGISLVAGSGAALWLERPARAEHLLTQLPPHQVEHHGGLPLSFEPNRGQLDPRVHYMARGQGYGLYLTDEGATLSLLRNVDGSDHVAPGNLPRAPAREEAVVSVHLVGSRPVRPVGDEQLPGHANFLIGNDPTQWRTGIETYAAVRYEGALPGVDVVYYGASGRELEYDLVLSPGVRPETLEVAFDGARSIELESDGSATIGLGAQQLLQRPPVAYQRDPSGARSFVPVRFQKRGTSSVGFVVGEYDERRPLVIDPLLQYSTYFGGAAYEETFGVAVDSTGSMYVVGYTSSTLLPTTAPVQPSHGGGFFDGFITKLQPDGLSQTYSTYFGGSAADFVYSVATDKFGNAYVAGLTSSNDLPTKNPLQAARAGGQDAFVAKLNPLGTSLIYSTYLGGSADDYARGIALDYQQNVYLVGSTFSTNLPLVAPRQATSGGGQDAFVAKLNPAGSALVYSSYLGGSSSDYGNAIVVDPAGSAYVAGSTSSDNFPKLNPVQATRGGGFDAFASKLNDSGSALVYSTFLGGSADDEATGIALDGSRDAFVVGATSSNNFPTNQPFQAFKGGLSDAFIAAFNTAGTARIYSTYLGGTGDDRANGLVVDSEGSAVVIGTTASANFPVKEPAQPSLGGGSDAFITCLQLENVRLAYSTFLGGSADDFGVGIAMDSRSNLFIAGSTQSTNFPVVLPAMYGGFIGSQDAFIARLSAPAVHTPATGHTWLLVGGLLLGVVAAWRGRRELLA